MKKYLIVAALGLLVAGFSTGLVVGPKKVHANPYYIITAASSYSSTSPTYMTPGTGTTTVTLDTGNSQDYNSTDIFTGETDTLVFQLTATTTLKDTATVFVRPEVSNDNIDWYPTSLNLNSAASTTQMTGTYADYKFVTATSTLNGNYGGTGSATKMMLSITFSQPANRYIRFVFYDPAGGQNYSLWAQLTAKKQTNRNY